MPKRPTKPSIPVVGVPTEDADLSSSSRHGHRCAPARAAIVLVDQLTQRVDNHIEANDEQIKDIKEGVAEVRGEVRAVNVHVGDLRVDVAAISSTVDSIHGTLAEQQQIKHVRMIAEVETGKAATIASIEDAGDRKKAVRAVWLKVLLLVIGLAGTALGMLIEHYR